MQINAQWRLHIVWILYEFTKLWLHHLYLIFDCEVNAEDMKTSRGYEKVMSLRLCDASVWTSQSLYQFFFFNLSRCTTCCHSSKPDVISVQSRASVSQCSLHLSLSLSPSPAGPWEIMACCIAVSGVIRLCGVAAPSLWCSCPLQGGWGPIAYTRYSDRAGGDWQQHAPVWDGRANPLLRHFSSGLQRRAARTSTRMHTNTQACLQ